MPYFKFYKSSYIKFLFLQCLLHIGVSQQNILYFKVSDSENPAETLVPCETESSKQQTTNNKQQTTNNKQQPPTNKQQPTTNNQQPTNNKQQTTNNKQQLNISTTPLTSQPPSPHSATFLFPKLHSLAQLVSLKLPSPQQPHLNF